MRRFLSWLPLLLMGAGLLLRSLRLTWQPLWWDEGYSVFFATEPLAAMLDLTARDIHPPLYYALLHVWLALWGNADPLTLRLLSVAIGGTTLPLFWLLARTLYPTRPGVPLIALLLLVINPMHIFYSQEVRMYGLEMALGVASSLAFWQMLYAPGAREKASWSILYGVGATTLLYTEYYAALLLLVHFSWGVWATRRERPLLGRLLLVYLGVGVAYLPWLLYSGGDLLRYVAAKVVADQDSPLGPGTYLVRHLVAFLGGHTAPNLMQPVVALGLVLGLGGALWSRFAGQRVQANRQFSGRSLSFSAIALILPLGVGFVQNVRLPFFPVGGERILLFVLPAFLLLLADGIDRLRSSRLATLAALSGVMGIGITGLYIFYTTPRYVTDDYRPIVQQVTEEGTDADTVVAIFPWQVGFWRAYGPLYGRSDPHGPWPHLLSFGPVAWDQSLATELDQLAQTGVIWTPLLRSIGSTLPAQMEAYLRTNQVNVENLWSSPTTSLGGWIHRRDLSMTPIQVDFGPIRLTGVGVGPNPIVAANQVLQVKLAWQPVQPIGSDLRLVLRIQDQAGWVWAARDLWPLGHYASPSAGEAEWTEQVGILVPTGLPPGAYQVAVGVGQGESGDLLPPGTLATGDSAQVAGIQVTAPETALPLLRLPVRRPLQPPVSRQGVTLWGGSEPIQPVLAGTAFDLILFASAQIAGPTPGHLYLSLLDAQGAGVAGWEGWPLPNHPPQAWQPGEWVRLPLTVQSSAYLASGDYELVTGFVSPQGDDKSPPASLGRVQIRQRSANMLQPDLAIPLQPPIQFGAHAQLIGYDSIPPVGESGMLVVTLTWQVLQPLLPPHRIFVHLVGPDGRILAQDDRDPTTLGAVGAIPAPSGSWQAGEYLVDRHAIELSAPIPPGSVLRVGLYQPQTGVRLPVSRDDQILGDWFGLQP